MGMLLIFVAMVIPSFVAGYSLQKGVIILRAPEKEFKEGLDHLIVTTLEGYVEDGYKFDDYDIVFKDIAKLYVKNIKLNEISGMVSRVDFKPGNIVEADYRFQTVSFQSDITLWLSGETTHYAAAIISIIEPFFNISIKIGTGDDAAGLTILECALDFNTLDSPNKEVRQSILGLVELGAKEKLKALFGSLCPYLEETAEAILGDVLKIEEQLTIYDGANELISIEAKLESVSTFHTYISASASAVGEAFAGPTGMPSVHLPVTTVDKFQLWFDDTILVILTETMITESVFTDTRYSIDVNGNHLYDVYASLVSANYTLAITDDGIVVHATAQLTINHVGQAENPCITLTVTMGAEVPIIITYNDVKVVMSSDVHRLKLDYHVTEVTGKCQAKDTAIQVQLMKEYDAHFQAKLKDSFFFIDVPKTTNFGFKDIEVKTYPNAALVQGLLQLDLNAHPSRRNTTITHKNAGGKRVSVIDTSKQTTTLELIDPTTPPTSVSTDNKGSVYVLLVLIGLHFILSMCFQIDFNYLLKCS